MTADNLRERLATEIRAVSYDPLPIGLAMNHATVALQVFAEYVTLDATVERAARAMHARRTANAWDACGTCLTDARAALAAALVAEGEAS